MLDDVMTCIEPQVDIAPAAEIEVAVHAFDVGTEVVFAFGQGTKSNDPRITRRGNNLVFKGVQGNVTYVLQDHTERGLVFDADPIWSDKGCDCPQSEGGEYLIVLDQNDLDLKVQNRRRDKTVSYALRFKDRGGTTHTFDPIIRNTF